MLKLLTAVWIAWLVMPAASADVEIPTLLARVTDTTGTLDAEHRAALESKLAAFEQQKGSQIAVLMVPSTRPETIEQYGIRVGEAWKIGRKGVDDGVILIVAKDDHRVRIEVGYGLEGVLNDATAKRIISETITPHFKAEDFAGGVDAGVQQMIGVIKGEPLPAPRPSHVIDSSHPEVEGVWTTLSIAMNLLFFWLPWWVLGFKSAAALGLGSAAIAGYADTGDIAGAIVPLAFAGFVWGFCAVARLGVSRSGKSSYRSSSSSGSRSSTSSSFSGGGGSFGGGGASGSW